MSRDMHGPYLLRSIERQSKQYWYSYLAGPGAPCPRVANAGGGGTGARSVVAGLNRGMDGLDSSIERHQAAPPDLNPPPKA